MSKKKKNKFTVTVGNNDDVKFSVNTKTAKFGVYFEQPTLHGHIKATNLVIEFNQDGQPSLTAIDVSDCAGDD